MISTALISKMVIAVIMLYLAMMAINKDNNKTKK